MCNISVILRRNVMYLYSQKPHLDQLFHCQSSRYHVIRWIFGTKNKGKLICNSSNDIISGNFDSEKVDQDGIFYYKDILHFFFQWPKYYTYQKSILWLVALWTTLVVNFKGWFPFGHDVTNISLGQLVYWSINASLQAFKSGTACTVAVSIG